MNKFSIKKITLALALTGFASLTFATTTVLTVNGMVCAFCAQGIEKRLSKLPETKAVFVDLKQKIVAVEAKEGMILDKKVLQAEVKDAGYDVVKVEDTARPVSEIKGNAKSPKSAAMPATLTAGEVRKIDLANNTVTIKHEYIKNLEMPAMTMDFQVANKSELAQVKQGDKINFRVENVKGELVITSLQNEAKGQK